MLTYLVKRSLNLTEQYYKIELCNRDVKQYTILYH